jgi:hypothetical protein
MKLDIALVERSATEWWYPIRVAMEHENVASDFGDTEVPKLFSVRCPFKVGITYVQGQSPQKGLAKIREHLRNRFDVISHVVGEDPRTEYLFLVGAPLVVSSWYALDFRASEGLGNKDFQPLELPTK